MPPPVNDDIANAVTLSGSGGTAGPYTIDAATRQGSEPNPGSLGFKQTIWFKFTASVTGTATFSTYGSIAGDSSSGDGTGSVGPYGSLDTQLAVYSAPGLSESGFSNLGLLSDNDDYSGSPPNAGDGDYWSYISMSVTAGVSYYVQLGTFDTPYTGTASLTYTITEAACGYPFIVGFNVVMAIGSSGLTSDNSGFSGLIAAGKMWVVTVSVVNGSTTFNTPSGYTKFAEYHQGGISAAMFGHLCTGTEGAPAFTWSGSGDAILINQLWEPPIACAGKDLEIDFALSGQGNVAGSLSTYDPPIIDPYWGDESSTSYTVFVASAGPFHSPSVGPSGMGEVFARDTNADLHVDTLQVNEWSEGRTTPGDAPGSYDPATITWGVTRDRISFGYAIRVGGPTLLAFWGFAVTHVEGT